MGYGFYRVFIRVFSDDVSCAVNPCFNGGQCQESVNTVLCACSPGTVGELCSSRSQLLFVVSFVTIHTNYTRIDNRIKRCPAVAKVH